MACIAAAQAAGIDTDHIKEGIATFKGVNRRMEMHVNTPEVVYIDDYAHHPSEIRASITSVRQLYAGRKITVIFQPHLYTRTRDFADEFAQALSLADEVLLLPIYPARELPIEGVSSEMLLDKLTCAEKNIYSKENLINSISVCNFDVLLTVGAGDIANLLPKIVEEVKKQRR
jgi:UDP-N-acetylmuramate--alanine ligase